jgi:hypothetical protein
MYRGRATTRSLLRDPRVDALIETVSPRRVTSRGLFHDYCDVSAIMDPGKKGEVEEIRQGLQVVVRATRGKLAVTADSEAALALVRDVDPDRFILVSRNAGQSIVRRHLQAGGQAVMTARDHGEHVMVLCQGDQTILSIPCATITDFAENPSRMLIDAHLFAIALAHGMGLSTDQITSALRDNHFA